MLTVARLERVLTLRESRDCPQGAGGRSKQGGADDVHPAVANNARRIQVGNVVTSVHLSGCP